MHKKESTTTTSTEERRNTTSTLLDKKTNPPAPKPIADQKPKAKSRRKSVEEDSDSNCSLEEDKSFPTETETETERETCTESENDRKTVSVRKTRRIDEKHPDVKQKGDLEQRLMDLERKKILIEGRIQDKHEDISDIDTIYESVRRKIYHISEQNIHRLITELETGGNIRFEEGRTTDKWYTSCSDLVKSRFNNINMAEFGISDISVTRFVFLFLRFFLTCVLELREFIIGF